MKKLILITLLLPLVGAGCIASGSQRAQLQTLPDVIEEGVDGDIIAQAIKEVRLVGKSGLTITQEDGDTITLILTEPTMTRIILTDNGEHEDPLQYMIDRWGLAELERAHSIAYTPGETLEFGINIVNEQHLAEMVHALSLRLQGMTSVEEWSLEFLR